MENTEPKKTTVYEFFDRQTVKERRTFIADLRAKGINPGTVRNWTNKQASVPPKYQELISDMAGEQLAFPKLIRKVFIESEA